MQTRRFHKLVLINLLAVFLVACAIAPTTPLPSPTVTIEPVAATVSPLSTLRPPQILPTPPFPFVQPPFATLEPMPTAAAAWITPVPSQVHSLQLGDQEATALALDERYLYWVPAPGINRIVRYPLKGGQVDTVATSRFNQFGDGYLGFNYVRRRGDWLIFTDTRDGDYSAWTIHTLNVKTGQDQIVLDEPGNIIISWPDYDVDGDWFVWTRVEHSKEANCDQSILAARNLKTGELREMDRVCTLDNYMWEHPHLSGNELVVQQDLPDSKNAGTDLYLFDLSTGKRTAVTHNQTSSMPTMSGKWLVWKNAPRYSWGTILVIYDMNNGQRRSLNAPFPESSDPKVTGHWLYWWPEGLQPFVAYDLEKGQFLTITTPGSNEALSDVAIYGNVAVWCRRLNADSGHPGPYFLEWRTLP